MRIPTSLQALSISTALFATEHLARASDEGEIPLRTTPTPHTAQAPTPTSAPSPSEPRMRTEWYGWQTLTLDGATLVGAIGGSLAAKSAVPSLVAGGFFIISGSIVHGLHGRGPAALASFGLRAGLPAAGTLIGGLIGFLATVGESNSAVGSGVFGGLFGGALGCGVGVITASTLDAVLLGHETVPDTETKTTSFRLSPTVGFTRSGANAGIAGTF